MTAAGVSRCSGMHVARRSPSHSVLARKCCANRDGLLSAGGVAMANKHKAPTCSKCGAKLLYKSCFECDGRGWVRVALIFKKDCEVCGGKGGHWVCPDRELHKKKRPEKEINIFDRSDFASAFKKTGQIKLPANQPKPTLPQVVKPVVPPVPPPWHPMNPNVFNPMHPRSPYNPANPNSPLNPMNPANPNSPLNPMNPMNPMSPRNPNNPMNPMNPHKPFKP